VKSTNAAALFLQPLAPPAPAGDAIAELRAADGSAAVLARTAGGAEVLRVSDRRGRLLFEYHPAERRAVVHAPDGDLDLEAAGRVRVRAGAIELEAADLLGVRARRAELTFGRLIERAREVYREAEEVAETRAGRLRFLAGKTLHLLAERALVKARADVKVKGEKIYVG
jgi:hypothetical protein